MNSEKGSGKGVLGLLLNLVLVVAVGALTWMTLQNTLILGDRIGQLESLVREVGQQPDPSSPAAELFGQARSAFDAGDEARGVAMLSAAMAADPTHAGAAGFFAERVKLNFDDALQAQNLRTAALQLEAFDGAIAQMVTHSRTPAQVDAALVYQRQLDELREKLAEAISASKGADETSKDDANPDAVQAEIDDETKAMLDDIERVTQEARACSKTMATRQHCLNILAGAQLKMPTLSPYASEPLQKRIVELNWLMGVVYQELSLGQRQRYNKKTLEKLELCAQNLADGVDAPVIESNMVFCFGAVDSAHLFPPVAAYSGELYAKMLEKLDEDVKQRLRRKLVAEKKDALHGL